MDVQYIGSGEAAKAALYYITDYITKSSLKVHAGLTALIYAIQKNGEKYDDQQEVTESVECRSLVNKMVNRMMARQEMSHQQIMSYYVGGGDHYTTHEYRNLQWGQFSRLITNMEEALLDAPSDGDVEDIMTCWRTTADETQLDAADLTLNIIAGTVSVSSQAQDYIYRPEHAEYSDLCLWDFVAYTEKRAIPKSVLVNNYTEVAEPNYCFAPSHPQAKTHCLRRVRKEYVPTVIGSTLPRQGVTDEEREGWCRAMVILFKPWRTLYDLLGAYSTWAAAFDSYTFTARHIRIMSNMDVLNQCKEARDNDLRGKLRKSRIGVLATEPNEEDLDTLEEHLVDDAQLDVRGEELNDPMELSDAMFLLPTRASLGAVSALNSAASSITTSGVEDLALLGIHQLEDNDHPTLKSYNDQLSKWRADKRPLREDYSTSEDTQYQPPENLAAYALPDYILPAADTIEDMIDTNEATVDTAVEAVIQENNLQDNKEQCLVLRIVADYLTGKKNNQLSFT
ncbi:hypothetical protein CALCODRAFT_508697 [Calocera cornea HHB12733]|uniref:Uncharacterized protein n=1 Tax=Calocera cornea HHB12733 TaxID=1353952 RepID=A0A165G4D6_9BASI|nr:hypothetical protein CALCODRAFT_508697 [Calocera cornea HHB12733]